MKSKIFTIGVSFVCVLKLLPKKKLKDFGKNIKPFILVGFYFGSKVSKSFIFCVLERYFKIGKPVNTSSFWCGKFCFIFCAV